MRYPHLAARIFNTPLLVHPGKLDAILAGLGERLLGSTVQQESSVPAEMFSTRRGERSDNGYRIVDGVAVIHAGGALVHRSQFVMADSSYLLGYNELAGKLEAAMGDPEVHAVLQVFDSPGGEVSGAFEYGDRIHALRGKKPMWAVADAMAASAAYLAGSAFDRLGVNATGYVGSIGVVLRHVDFSRALGNEGIQVTHVYAGAKKVDGTPYEPLSRSVQADFQVEVDGLYAMFVEAVVRNRGHLLTADAVRATQADTYRGQAAVDRGLADLVGTSDQMLSELAALRTRPFAVSPPGPARALSVSSTSKGAAMADPASAPPQGGFSQTDIDQARAEGVAQGKAMGRAEGAQAERERIQAVRTQALPGHEALIESLAFDGKTTGPEAAASVLAAERSARAAAAAAHKADAPNAAPASPAPDTAGQPSARELGKGIAALFHATQGVQK